MYCLYYYNKCARASLLVTCISSWFDRS